MIFVTIGTQLPFPRLIDAMDALAPALDEPVVAQVGPDTATRRNMEVHSALAPDAYEALFAAARIIVAHAGIGTILAAKRLGKPLILVPRQYDLSEHRNDHQMATAREMSGRQGIHVVWDTGDLPPLLKAAELEAPEGSVGPSSGRLIERIRSFIDQS